jgi:hypothetical protein
MLAATRFTAQFTRSHNEFAILLFADNVALGTTNTNARQTE